MKQKMVCYVGGTNSDYPCADPKVLVKGGVYEVIATRDGAFQKTYSLNGVRGWFDAKWFSIVNSSFCGIRAAVTDDFVTVDKGCKCQLIGYHDEMCELNPWTTSPVEKIKRLCKNVLFVKTHQLVYVLMTESSEKMGMLVTHEIPDVRKCCEGYKLVLGENDKWEVKQWCTAPIRNMKFFGGNVYMVQDEKATYVVQVN